MNDAVVHQKHVLAVTLDDCAVLGVVDEIDVLFTRIRDKDAAEPPIGPPLADLDEQAFVDLAETAFLHDGRQ